MTESLGERIKRLRKERGLSQAALAEACGWKSQSRVGNYEVGTREPTFADLQTMARALGVRPTELVPFVLVDEVHRSEYVDPLPSPAKAVPPIGFTATPMTAGDFVRDMLGKAAKLPDDLRGKILAAAEHADNAQNVVTGDFSRPGLVGDEVWIAHYDVRGAMGGGQSIQDFPEMLKDIRVSPSHLREMGVEFEEYYHLKLVTGWGQSMEPTIRHRDPLIVNAHIREFAGDGIYVFFWDDHVYIKRLQVADEDHFEMISDNPKHKDRLIRRDMTYIQARVLLVWNAHLV
jgi:transcriptional regulator with XRE-family HTH domain